MKKPSQIFARVFCILFLLWRFCGGEEDMRNFHLKILTIENKIKKKNGEFILESRSIEGEKFLAERRWYIKKYLAYIDTRL